MSPNQVPRASLSPGYEIPRVINGCWQLATGHRARKGGSGAVGNLVQLARLGLTAFDGADIYTGVEDRLGSLRREWLAGGGQPAELSIHTKLVPDRGVLPTIDRRYVERIVHRSRRRLAVDCLDLVQLHWWDFEVTGWVETAGWLDALRAAGSVAHIGVTNFDATHLEPVLEAGVEVVSNQVQYSLLDRRPERGTAAFCRQRGVRLLAYGVLAGGFLSDRWLGAPDPSAPLANRSLTKYRLIVEELGGWSVLQELLGLLDVIARRHRVSIANVATRWVLDRPGVAAVILGVASAEYGQDNLRSFGLELDEADRESIADFLSRHPGPAGDVYAFERVAGGRHATIMKTDLNRIQ